VNWDEFDKEMRELQSRIDWRPDIICGIARGGVIPATILSKRMKVKDMFTLSLDRQGERKISAFAIVDISGKKILLVEDMLETGRGLIAGKKFLEERGAEVRTACLYTMPKSEIVPDFFLRQFPDVQHFPWE